MLKPLPELTARNSVLRALREPSAQQHTRSMGRYDEPTGPVCFMGMIVRTYFQAQPEGFEASLPDEDSIFAWIGLTPKQAWRAVEYNDHGWSFAKLADWLEAAPLTTTKDQTQCSTPASNSFSPASSAVSSEAHSVLELLGCFAADA